MRTAIRRLLALWGDAAARARLADLETALAVQKAAYAVLEAERDQLAAIAARDRARVLAETAAYAKGAAR